MTPNSAALLLMYLCSLLYTGAEEHSNLVSCALHEVTTICQDLTLRKILLKLKK